MLIKQWGLPGMVKGMKEEYQIYYLGGKGGFSHTPIFPTIVCIACHNIYADTYSIYNNLIEWGSSPCK